MKSKLLSIFSLLFFTVMFGVSAQGNTLTVGLASEPTSTDPHYHDLSPNNSLAKHIYESLQVLDANFELKPGLATSVETTDDKTWIINLRKGVEFSNGDPFTADDVIFTFCRIMNNPTTLSGAFQSAIKNFKTVEKVNDYTLKITTKVPEPLLREELGNILIISDSILPHGKISFDLEGSCGITGEWPGLNKFNNGEMAIGTGAYKLVKFTKGSSIELVRNENYWGKKPDWSSVKFVPVPNGGPRLAGLLSGDFDVIEKPSARDLKKLKEDPKFAITVKPSSRVIYLQMDVFRDDSPTVKADNGKNPFMDVRVRQAISMAIDRKTIVKRIMDGVAEVAPQYVPKEMFGAIPNPVDLPFDPEKAKQLLADAGYPNGFKLTLSATNDRYINDSQIAQAIAQFLTQIGITTDVDAMTRSIFFSRRRNMEFSFSMGGWGTSVGGAAHFFRQFATTYNKAHGLGGSNYGRWSDKAFDEPLIEAIQTVDPEKRSALLQKAGKVILKEMPFIPLHFESTIWASKRGIEVEGRMDQATLAMFIKKVK